MSSTITFNGVSYSVPATGDENWSDSLTLYLIAIASGALQKTGGTFTLTADTDFGATYGLKSAYYKSRATNPSSAGSVRLGNAESIGWRNAANNADLLLKANASNVLEYNGNAVLDAGSSALTGLITNAMVNASAAIAYSKLNLATSIVNADVSGSAAIAYSKLNLATSILNADINASAAIALSKLAALTTGKVLQSNASTGAIEASSISNTTLGYLDATSSVQTQLDAKIAKSLVTTTGDMIYASGASTPARLAVGGSGQVLKSVGGLPTWATFSGGINYLSSNPDAEADTARWATYADAAASSPVDGTGGSPSSTFTRSTSSPLRGQASFLWTKSANNRQGEGFSYDFTIDASDKAKVLQISFDYLVSSGTYADSDMTVWIYDVTNATLIQPAGYTIQNATVSMTQKATFQSASNSTSYRLIVHTASVSAIAYSLQFDNFSVGPQIVTNGAAVTDWISFTPTGSWSTNTTYTGYWRRNGGDVEVQFKVATSGAPTSANLTINLPSGMAMDTSRIVETANISLGWLRGRDEGTGSWSGWVKYNNTTSVAANYITVSSASDNVSLGVVSQAAPMTFANTDYLVGYFKAPIVGWSSNVQLSSDTDTRVVAAKYTGNDAASLSGTPIVIKGMTLAYDTHSFINLTTGAITIPVSGKYEFTVQAGCNALATATNQYYLIELRTGSTANAGTVKDSSNQRITNGCYVGTSTHSYTLDCLAGDVYSFQVSSDVGAARAIQGGFIAVKRLSGPSVVAASETVHARYGGSTTTLTNSSTVAVTFTTKEKDTHNAYSGSTFTVPVSGTYQVVMNLETAAFAAAAVGNAMQGIIKKNGTGHSVSTLSAMTTAAVYYAPLTTALISCLAGDTLQGCAYHNLGTTPTLNNQTYSCYISFTRVGNY